PVPGHRPIRLSPMPVGPSSSPDEIPSPMTIRQHRSQAWSFFPGQRICQRNDEQAGQPGNAHYLSTRRVLLFIQSGQLACHELRQER
ncbi:MAG: hypothetical protein ACRD1T_03875, partial [Acidimicrobiia bacterium]